VVTRYRRIADDLRGRILASVFPPGCRLPSNRELAVHYRTSLGTARKALELLANQGWVRVEHGNGTFVADVGWHGDMLASLDPSSFVVLRGAGKLETRVLSVKRGVRDGEAQRALGLDGRRTLVCIERLRMIDGCPLILQSSYLSGEHGPAVAAYRGEEPLYVFVRAQLGLVAARSDEWIVAAQLDARDAGLLEQPVGALALRARRTSFTFEGQPIMFDAACIVTGRLSLHIHRQGHDVRAMYALVDGADHPVGVPVGC
jgi:GntR family transcriptional regulator